MAYLLAMDRPPEERANHRTWVECSLPRYVRTLEMVPPGAPGQRCLEIGSMPYTFSLLMRKFRQYELSHVDFFSGAGRQHHETVRLPSFQETHEFTSYLYDVERERLPFADASFDGILCTEILEHLTVDPAAMCAEIHRLLKPSGWVIVTTPNVANLANILHLVHGRNVYRPYEPVFGPTWRHNREYTTWEVGDLLRGSGFTVERLFAEDAGLPGYREPLSQRLLRRLLELIYRQNYCFQVYAVARRGPAFRWYYPPWLYHHVDLHNVPHCDYIRVGENDAIQLGVGWGRTEVADGTKDVRWIAGAAATACIRASGRKAHLVIDVYQRHPRRQHLSVAVAPFPPRAGGPEDVTEVTLDATPWQTYRIAVNNDTGEALALTFRRAGDDATAPEAFALHEIRWE